MSSFLVKSFFWLTLSEVVYNASSYVIHAGMGRILGPADYGRFGIIVTLTTMVIVLVGQGVPTAMAKYLGEIYDTKLGLIPVIKRKTAKIQFALVGSTTVAFFLFSPVLARILGDPTLTPLFRLSSFVMPAFALASFYFYYYTGIHRFNIQSWLKTTRAIARLVFILGLAWLLNSRGYALEGAIVGYILAPLSVFFEANLLDPHKKVKPAGFFDWRKLFQYAWPMTLFLVAYEFLITIDLYLVKGILKDDVLTGLYNGAITVGRIPYFLFYALTIIMLPAVSRATSSENKKETKKLISQSLRLLVMFLAPISILMAVYALPVLKIFYTSKFAGAADPMSVLMPGVAFLTIFYVMAYALNGAGKVKVTMIVAALGLAVNIVASYFLIQKYALMGAALATTLTSFVAMLVLIVYMYRFFGYLFRFTSFLKILVASAVLYFASTFFPASDYLFILWSAILFGIYLSTLFALGEFGSRELELVRQLLSRKKRSA